jgi:S1-C subfamily serine protease
VNLIDLAAIVLLVVAVVLGLRSGALPQVGGLGGALLAAATGLAILPAVASYLDVLPPTVRAVATLSGLLLFVGLGEAVGATLGRAASNALGRGVLSALDQVAGAAVGAAQAVLIVWLAGGVLAAGPLTTLRQQAQTSAAVRGLSAVLPPPTVLVVELGHVLNDTGLPDVFVGLERLPAPDITLPADSVARQLGARVEGSVLRVVADACQVRSSGTSFVVAPGYLVTNAHVVAGSQHIAVETPRAAYTAVPVLFDPNLDIAVLHVTGLAAAPLVFAAADPQRGASGATFGYPGGRDASVEPATVAATYAATGLDIDGRQSVTREIVEMRSTVIPGDSGGPLLLTDGTVGGVVFAESRSDATVGYALAPTEVAARIRPYLGANERVDTGGCIH